MRGACRTGASDPFTGHLLDIFETVLAEGITQPAYLGIHRSDYMIDRFSAPGNSAHKAPELKQIEINTISAAFAGLSTKVSGLHRYMLERMGNSVAGARSYMEAIDSSSRVGSNDSLDAHLPPNQSLTSVAATIAAAHKLYGSQG